MIITRCSDPGPRLIERNTADRLIAQPAVLREAGASSVAEHTVAMVGRVRAVELEMMTRFPLPTLTVDTTDQYNPSLDTILEFAVRRDSPAPGSLGQSMGRFAGRATKSPAIDGGPGLYRGDPNTPAAQEGP